MLSRSVILVFLTAPAFAGLASAQENALEPRAAVAAPGSAVMATGESLPDPEPVAAIRTGETPDPDAPPAPAPAPVDDSVEPDDPGAKGQLRRESIVENRDAAGALETGWAYFDDRQWESARQWFQKALQFDSQSKRAAEGLVMSVYRSGEPLGAYRIAKEHAALVPEGPGIVVKAVSTTGQQLVNDGELEKAETLLDGFPDSEDSIAAVRRSIAASRVETAVARQEYEEARAISRSADLDTEAVAREESADLLQQATEARDDGNHRASLDLVEKAEKTAPLERSGERVKAWALYQNREFDQSAELFEKLYREGKDRDSAEGLVNSLQQSGKTNELAKISDELGGPLATASEPVLLAAAKAEEEKQRRERERQRELAMAEQQFDQAPATSRESVDSHAPPDSFRGAMGPSIAAAGAAHFSGDPIDRRRQVVPESSNIDGGGGFRVKEGDGGLDRLRVTHLPTVQTTLVFGAGDKQSLTFGVHALSLDAGDFHSRRLVGSADSTLDPKPFVTETDTLVEPYLAYRFEEGDRAFFAEIGTTPIGADISAAAVGAIGIEWQGERAAAGIQGFSESVEESLLSYTGMTDPYTGDEWGRVVRRGVRADGAVELGENWGAHGLFEFSRLTGEGVADNTAVAADLGLNYQLDVPGFDHVAIGPNFHFESYDKNLSQFTYGHGGYFSPDSLYQGMFGVSFLTETGGAWLAEGFLGVGAQTHDTASAPVLPNAPDGRFYDASSDSGAIFTARLQTLFELNQHWRLGAQAGYAKTAAYEDYAVSLYLSFLFDPEWGLDQSDFSGWR
ncbi:MAG: BCSC C-terminal domain-containing protein [Verrucomicrobiae bacterium]|nr:BCSC C-terminal domain-containing protein [Verrucomicrobiae bacterium]